MLTAYQALAQAFDEWEQPERAAATYRRLVDPPIDPHWNRGLAMAWEHADENDVAKAEDYWRAYLEDLIRVECLLPGERAGPGTGLPATGATSAGPNVRLFSNHSMARACI